MNDLEEKLKHVKENIHLFESNPRLLELKIQEKGLNWAIRIAKYSQSGNYYRKMNKYELFGYLFTNGRKILVNDIEDFVSAKVPSYEKETKDMRLLLNLLEKEEISVKEADEAYNTLSMYGFKLYFLKIDSEYKRYVEDIDELKYEKMLVLELDSSDGDWLSHGFTERRTVKVLMGKN